MDRVSLTVRLTAFYVLASTLLLLGMAAFISSAIQQHFAELDRETLNDKIQLVRGIVANAASLEDLRGRLNDALQSHPGLYVRIDGADGLVLYDTAAFQFPPALLQQPPAAVGQHTSAWHDGQASYQGVVATLAAGAVLKQDARMVAAVDTAHHAHFMADLRHSLWLYVLAGAASSGVLGWWATRAGLTPLRRMKAKAQLVTANKLDQRMDVEAIPVELADLATSLNEMLQRLQNDFERLSDFSSDLAHELRTPLNNLLTQTEVVLSRSRDLTTYRDTLASNGEELQRLARMVSDMLLLAKAEHGLLHVPTLADIDLAHEVKALFDFYEALAEENEVRLLLQGAAHVKGDSLMLRRAISNLLSNALRYAPQGTDIVVRLDPLPGAGARISVANRGAPIPQDMLPRLFDRFFRADKARAHHDSDGAGLGLSITQAIAQAHGGTVCARSQDGHNVFVIELP